MMQVGWIFTDLESEENGRVAFKRSIVSAAAPSLHSSTPLLLHPSTPLPSIPPLFHPLTPPLPPLPTPLLYPSIPPLFHSSTPSTPPPSPLSTHTSSVQRSVSWQLTSRTNIPALADCQPLAASGQSLSPSVCLEMKPMK